MKFSMESSRIAKECRHDASQKWKTWQMLLWNDRLEKLAEAHRQRVILEAEAEAEAIRLNGEAHALAVEARAKAEAEQMSKKAAAFKEYGEAAVVDMLLTCLPKVINRNNGNRHPIIPSKSYTYTLPAPVISKATTC